MKSNLKSILASALLVVALAPGVVRADSLSDYRKNLGSAPDFRVRVSSALALGKAQDLSSRESLVLALKDKTAAVRAAAGAALAQVGDKTLAEAIDEAARSEPDAATKRSLEKSAKTLRLPQKTRYVVSVAQFQTPPSQKKMAGAFQEAVRKELARLPGVEVTGTEAEAVARAKAQKVPAMALDAKLVEFASTKSGAETAVDARVEFLLRKIPDQMLKGTVKGTARGTASHAAVKTDKAMASLQEDTLVAAVQSATEGAPPALLLASK